MPFDSVNLQPYQNILLGAADLLEREGWTQEIYGRYGDSKCAVGALIAAAGTQVRTGDNVIRLGPEDSDSAFDEAVIALNHTIYKRFRSNHLDEALDFIYNWNDVVSRRGSHVVRKLREAAFRGILCTPAIVRASSLMPIKPWVPITV